jgi:hypothetical protein
MLRTAEIQSSMAELNRRIENLEQRLHGQHSLCVALALVAVLAMLIRGGAIATPARADDEPPKTTTAPQVITARQVILVDEDGKKRVMLSGLKEMPGIFLMDVEEKQRAAIVLSAEGPAMYLCDPDGTKRLYCDVGRSPSLSIADAGGVPRAVLGLFDGKPALNIYASRSNAPAGKP